MTSLCSDILHKHPRRSCPILLRRYVFTLFRQENDLSTDALEMEITELSFSNLTASGILVSSGGSWNFSLRGQSFEELGVVRDSCGSHTHKWY